MEDPSSDVDAILEQIDDYIRMLARRKVPRNVFPPETLDLEIDELAQRVRIKLWPALQRAHIENLKAFVSCIVVHEVVNMLRRRKITLPLPVDEDGELLQGRIVTLAGEREEDPCCLLEQEESRAACLASIAAAVSALPSCQRRAMVCTLKDQVDDLLSLVNAFKEKQVEIEGIHWPEEKAAAHRLKASLSASRKKLRHALAHP